MKICSKCGVEKDEEEFVKYSYNNRKMRLPRCVYCRERVNHRIAWLEKKLNSLRYFRRWEMEKFQVQLNTLLRIRERHRKSANIIVCYYCKKEYPINYYKNNGGKVEAWNGSEWEDYNYCEPCKVKSEENYKVRKQKKEDHDEWMNAKESLRLKGFPTNILNDNPKIVGIKLNLLKIKRFYKLKHILL